MISQSLEKKKEILRVEQQALRDKLRVVKGRIASLEERPRSAGSDIQYDSGLTGSVVDSLAGIDEDNLQSLASLRLCIGATEELANVSVQAHTCQDVPGPSSGQWKEVNLDLDYHEFKCHLTFVANHMEGCAAEERVSSVMCAVAPGLARCELAGALKSLCATRNLASVCSAMARYSHLAVERRAALGRFSQTFRDHFRPKVTENGMVLVWRGNLFRLCWGLEWDEDTLAMDDCITVEVKKEAAFLRSCENVILQVMSRGISAKERLHHFIELGELASMHQSGELFYEA